MTLCRIRNALVVGCGGLGSEVIKILRNCSISIKALDFDCIETSNLNRQFFFTSKDNHTFKSQTIAKKIQCDHAVMRVEDMDDMLLDCFDVVFSCLDSISSRMELNYRFMSSNCPLMVDCGAEGMRWHVKRVTDHEPCLYCIKDLYSAAPELFLCSLGLLESEINAQNRERCLRSTVFKVKEQHACPEPSIFLEIANTFNQRAPEHLRASALEVEGIYMNIVPSVCTTNSICAGYAVLMALDHRDYDFVYFDGTEDPFAQRTRLAKDPLCFVCKARKTPMA